MNRLGIWIPKSREAGALPRDRDLQRSFARWLVDEHSELCPGKTPEQLLALAVSLEGKHQTLSDAIAATYRAYLEAGGDPQRVPNHLSPRSIFFRS